MKILIVNPGSTSTKIGMFEDERPLFEKTLRHSMEELGKFDKIGDQYDFRMQIIMDAIKQSGIEAKELDAVCGMGGLLRPIEGGTYYVNDAMVQDLRNGVQGEHASNLGGLIAKAVADTVGIPAFIADPVVVDEFLPISRVSGHPELTRRSIFHALNQKATARRYCREVEKKYEEVNLVVVHMGGGISVSAHQKGRTIDSNNALDGDGPFTPERSGGLPVGELAKLCFSGKYTLDEVKKMITGKGGMIAYFGTNNMLELEEKSKTDENVKLVVDALVLQIAKDIASMAAALSGEVNAVLLTGGIAYSEYITSEIKKRTSFIAPVKIYPGEDELMALNLSALRVLRKEEEGKNY